NKVEARRTVLFIFFIVFSLSHITILLQVFLVCYKIYTYYIVFFNKLQQKSYKIVKICKNLLPLFSYLLYKTLQKWYDYLYNDTIKEIKKDGNMKSKSLILALALGFVITGCNDSARPESKVSEETIAKALDGKVDLEKEKKEESKKETKEEKSKKESKFEVNGDTLRKLMVDMGEFAPSLARKLDDE